VTRDVSVASVELSPDPATPGETITCRWTLMGDVTAMSVRVRWYDQWGRLLLERAKLPPDELVEFPAPMHALSVLNRIEVALISARGVEALATAELRMPQCAPSSSFYVLYWNTGPGRS